jgi:signal peptidase II
VEISVAKPVSRKSKVVVSTVIIAVFVVVDQLVKLLAAQTLRGRPGISLLGGTLRFEYAENTGAFLSLGASLDPGTRTLLFVLGVVVIIGFCVVWLFKSANSWLTVIALSAVISGGVGNLIDRAWRGSVIDFIYMDLGGPLHTGVFNVADMAITGGLLLMLWDQYLAEKRKN